MKQRTKVLAEGEVTGHAHTVSAEDAWMEGNVLSAPAGTPVKHEEHKEFELPPGEYDVKRVVEMDHAAEEARQVRD